MAKVKFSEIERITYDLLCGSGVSSDDAKAAQEIFIRATLRGVGHHDIYDLSGRLKGLSEGKINAHPSISKMKSYGALESYEGDNGLGEVCGHFIMKRAQQLANEHGIGLCTIRNTSHFLAAAPYVEMAAEEGYIGYMITRGAPTMGAPGRVEQVIGTSPMGYAVPTDKEYPLMFDACLSYASFGVLQAKMKKGESVPDYWGFDAEGNPTTDPAVLAKGTRLPIAGHKGFGLTILGEIITGILSEGQIIDEPQPGTGAVGAPSLTAICIKADAFMSLDEFKERTSEMIDRMENRAPGLTIPGQRSCKSKADILAAGAMELEDKLVETLNQWAEKLNVRPIE